MALAAEGLVIATLLDRLARHLPYRDIEGGDGSVYLTKYLLWQSHEGRDSWRVHLHRFWRSDRDRELHNHPWRIAISLILAGGYREERRMGRAVAWRTVAPGHVNVIRPDTFHRVDLLGSESWSLFLSGPIVQSWGFWNRFTGSFTPWREFVARQGQSPAQGEYWIAKKVSDA